ncbi:MAG: DUF935 family protein [Deltaproteobacteria bacterium]|nr:DUF935 family protein [Deltaproteobacteria bacterium]
MAAVTKLDDYRARQRGIAQPVRSRARLNWRPRDIQDALYSADSGDLQMAAELCERLMADDRVGGVLATRTLGMLGLPLSLEGDDTQIAALSGTSGLDDDADGDWHTLHPENESAQIVAWGIVLGVGLGQRVPLPRKPGERQLHRMRCWHPSALHWRELPQDDPRREWGQSISWHVRTSQGSDQEITPGDGQWVLYLPYGETRPWAAAAWRALAFAWVLKHFALLDRARHLEVLGSPVRVGKAAPGATEGGRTKWRDQLRSLSRDSALVLPDGYSLELVEAKGNSWEMYSKQIDWADAAIAIVLAGQTVTTVGSSGFADGKAQDTIRRELIRFTSKTWASTLRKQSLRPWARLNFGTDATPLPKWDAESSEDRLSRARSMISLGEAVARLNDAFAPAGKRVDTNALAQQYGLPLIELPATAAAPTIAMAPTDVVNFITVDEVRASAGLKPHPDPATGAMNAALFKLLNEAKAAAQTAPAQPPGADGASTEVSRATQQREQDAAVSP